MTLSSNAAAGAPPELAELSGDAARLRRMMELGHPVLRSETGRVMTALGSTELCDEAAFKRFLRKNKDLVQRLDLEWRRATNPGGAHRSYLQWKGNRPVHRVEHEHGPYEHHPPGYTMRDINGLQRFLEEHRAEVRCALLDDYDSSRKAMALRRWEKEVLPQLLPRQGMFGGKYYDTLCHELSGAPELRGTSYGPRKSSWAAGRLRALAVAGALDLTAVLSQQQAARELATSAPAPAAAPRPAPQPRRAQAAAQADSGDGWHDSDEEMEDVDDESAPARRGAPPRSTMEDDEAQELIAASNIPQERKEEVLAYLRHADRDHARDKELHGRQVHDETAQQIMAALKGDPKSKAKRKERALTCKVRRRHLTRAQSVACARCCCSRSAAVRSLRVARGAACGRYRGCMPWRPRLRRTPRRLLRPERGRARRRRRTRPRSRRCCPTASSS